ncbi:hypothetical protein ACWC09_44620 [Streptomyces sp. NPDC001617]
MRKRMELGELLREQDVDWQALDSAPAKPTRDEQIDRVRRLVPCSVCGELAGVARVHDSPEGGSRWVDLCMPHAVLTWPPAPGMPTTWEGIFADLRDMAAELGLTMRPISEGEFQESSRCAWLRLGRRFHLVISATGQPTLTSWHMGETVARGRFTATAAEFRAVPGARVALIDEAERKTLAVWPDEA